MVAGPPDPEAVAMWEKLARELRDLVLRTSWFMFDDFRGTR